MDRELVFYGDGKDERRMSRMFDHAISFNQPLHAPQAVELLEDIDSLSSRVFGARHPDTAANADNLRYAREKLALAEQPVARRTRSKAEES